MVDMKKVLKILVLIAVIGIGVWLFLGKGFGFGGTGEGNGQKNEINNQQDSSSDTEQEIEKETVIIEVKQSQYLIDGVEVTLSEIESMLSGDNVENTVFILEDNYAATKAWDEIKKLFTSHEISAIEQ